MTVHTGDKREAHMNQISRAVALVALQAFLVQPAAYTQINIQTDDGNSVQIGPGGISVTKPGKSVQITNTGININKGNQVKVVTKSSKPVKKAKTNNSNLSNSTTVTTTNGHASITVGGASSNSNTTITTQNNGGNTQVTVESTSNGSGVTTSNIALFDNDLTATYQCSGNTCTINGNNCKITLLGTCKDLVISGNENEVFAQTVGRINLMGNENNVRWQRALSGQRPQVTILGNDNSVSKKE
jgi:hypothetical protein